jgi:hypothetical protein
LVFESSSAAIWRGMDDLLSMEYEGFEIVVVNLICRDVHRHEYWRFIIHPASHLPAGPAHPLE